MEIIIDSRQRRIDIDLEELRKKTERILEDLGCRSSVVLSVVLVDAAEMTGLNMKYREKTGPTNVLSFCQNEGEPFAGSVDLLGDIVICADVVADDAARLGYTDDEMVLYVLIHGILHLLGYHHDLPDDSAAMHAKVESIFQRLVPPVELEQA